MLVCRQHQQAVEEHERREAERVRRADATRAEAARAAAEAAATDARASELRGRLEELSAQKDQLVQQLKQVERTPCSLSVLPVCQSAWHAGRLLVEDLLTS